MKCVYCGSKEVTYDNTTKFTTCSDCGMMYDEKDIKKETEVNIFTLFMISFLCLIPIVNVFVVTMVTNSRVDDKYKNCFVTTMLMEYFIGMIVIIYSILWNYSDAKNDAINFFNEVESYVESLSISEYEPRYEVKYEFDYDKFIPSENENSEAVDMISKDFNLFDGISMKGSKVLEFVEAYKESDVVFLIQTKAMAEKHGREVYRNYGYQLSVTENGTDDMIKYFDIKNELELFTDDYGERVSLPYEGLTTKKFIFYVNPKKWFEFKHTSTEDIDVFILKELEE